MAVGTLSVSHGGYTVTFDKFSDETVPGGFLDEATLEFTQFGLAYSNGPVRRMKKIFSVSAYITRQQWNDLLNVHTSWDTERATGSNIAEVTITNGLLNPTSPVVSTGFFTSQPQLQKIAPGNNTMFLTTFVLQET